MWCHGIEEDNERDGVEGGFSLSSGRGFKVS